jgi:superkiller protein 3
VSVRHRTWARLLISFLLSPFLAVDLVAESAAESPSDPGAPLELAIASAESRLKIGDLAGADRGYRQALFEGWLLKTTLERLDGRESEAREALENASRFRVESPEELQSLAVAFFDMGQAAAAAEILTEIVGRTPKDPERLRLLAKALAASRQLEPAVGRLEEAAAASDDPEETFLIATDFLWLKKAEAAEPLFARVVAARPIPQTRVLIGRSYRDAGEYPRASRELRAALAQDPGVRRAHYYLGMVALAEATTDADRLDRAIAEFREELKGAPDDPLASEQLGLALLDAGRPEEALAALETATKGDARAVSFAHVARAQLALGRPADAAAAARRGLALAEEQGADEDDLEKMHYQLGLALRKTGDAAEAAKQLAEAREHASRAAAPPSSGAAAGARREASALATLSRAEREALSGRVREALVRAYFNLGVLQTQLPSAPRGAERFVRAAAFLERAAEIDPDFPQVQSSLGVAYFNARQFDKAAAPLARAVALPSADPGLRRMLAIAYINTQAYDKAAPLLRDDPQRASDPALQSAYGLALLKSGRPAEAEKILAAQIAARGETADLLVLLGQSQADQKKPDEAIASLRRALELDPKAANADATLGAIYLRRGQAQDAARHLEAAARLTPSDAALQEQLGQAYQKLGQADLASRHFEAARQLQARP